MTTLALDGGENVGYALFTDRGEDITRGVVKHTQFFEKVWEGGVFSTYESGFLYGFGYMIDTIVVEGIRHNPMINQGGSQRWESQVEGAARILSAVTDVKLVVQQPSILPVALMHESMEWPKTRTGKKKHLPDDLSAWLHGRYYLRSVSVLD